MLWPASPTPLGSSHRGATHAGLSILLLFFNFSSQWVRSEETFPIDLLLLAAGDLSQALAFPSWKVGPSSQLEPDTCPSAPLAWAADEGAKWAWAGASPQVLEGCVYVSGIFILPGKHSYAVSHTPSPFPPWDTGSTVSWCWRVCWGLEGRGGTCWRSVLKEASCSLKPKAGSFWTK